MNIKMDGIGHIDKKVKLTQLGREIRITEMKNWVGTIYNYDPRFNKFYVCWNDGINTHHFKEPPEFITIQYD